MTPEQALPMIYGRKERRRELAVGSFVLVGLAATLALMFSLTDPALFRGRFYVFTVVKDAGGVRRGDPVQMRGVNIGRIRDFELVPGGVKLRLEVEGEYRIPSGSKVLLASGGVLAGRVATILPSDASSFEPKGALLPGVMQEGPVDQVSSLAGRASQTLERVQNLLDEQTVSQVHESTASAAALLEDLRTLAHEQRSELQTLTQSLRRSAKGLEGAVAGPQLERTVKRLDTLSAQLEKTSTSLERSSNSLEVVLGRIERGEGTLGRMSRDDSLYVNASRAANTIESASAELRALVKDIQQNPKRYLDVSVF